MSAAAEAQLILKYFGTFGKKVASSSAGHKAVAAALPKGGSAYTATKHAGQGNENLSRVTFFPAALRQTVGMTL